LIREDFAAYLGEIQRLDVEVGKLLAELKKRGLEQNTLVVFIGDNGGALLRGKGTLYDLGIHVPLIAHHPGRIKPGQVSKAIVSGEDIAPTFLEAADVPVPKNMTGKSLVSSFKAPTNPTTTSLPSGVHTARAYPLLPLLLIWAEPSLAASTS
jgi:arylsulfatase A-like enzyme